MCVGNLTIICSDNSLSPGRHQAITWTNAGILLGINFSEILIEIYTFSFKKMHLKTSSAKRCPFCLGLNVLKRDIYIQGLYSLSGKTSYRKISWSLEAARFGFKLFQSLWNLAGTSAALLPRCLSNFRAIRPLPHPISRLRDFTRFGGKTSYRLVNRCPSE